MIPQAAPEMIGVIYHSPCIFLSAEAEKRGEAACKKKRKSGTIGNKHINDPAFFLFPFPYFSPLFALINLSRSMRLRRLFFGHSLNCSELSVLG